jgi:hypothetical protein
MTTENHAPEDDDQDFHSGFSGNDIDSTTTPDDDDTAGTEESQNQPEDTQQAETVTQAPEYVQITKQDFERLNAAATAIDEIKADSKRQFDSAFGKIGGMQQVLQQIQGQTPSGQAVELDESDFAELKEQWPELADLTLKGFNKALAKLKGTGAPAASIDVDKLVAERVAPELDKVRQEYRAELTDLRMRVHHADWKTVLNSDAFIAWEKTLPQEEREQFLNSSDPDYVAGTISKFKTSQTEAQAKARKNATRQELIDAAVTPRGSGGHPSVKTDEDDFYAGFNSG